MTSWAAASTAKAARRDGSRGWLAHCGATTSRIAFGGIVGLRGWCQSALPAVWSLPIPADRVAVSADVMYGADVDRVARRLAGMRLSGGVAILGFVLRAVIDGIGHALGLAWAMAWEILWALILGFAL